MPTALIDIVKRFNDDGKNSKQRESSYTTIFSKYESNILTIVSSSLASICAVIIIDNYGKTNQITVTGDKPRAGELDTACESFILHRIA